jgi:hypothetical protein
MPVVRGEGWEVAQALICAVIWAHPATSEGIRQLTHRDESPGIFDVPGLCPNSNLYLQAGGRWFEPSTAQSRKAWKNGPYSGHRFGASGRQKSKMFPSRVPQILVDIPVTRLARLGPDRGHVPRSA